MSRRAMTAMARRNPVSTRVVWIAGLAAGAAVLIGGVAYAATRPKGGGGGGATTPPATTPPSTPPATPTPGPVNNLPVPLRKGERYLVMLSGPASIIQSPTLANQAGAQQVLDQLAPGEFRVVSLTVGGTPPTASLIIDVIGPDFTPPAAVLQGVQTLIGLGASFTVTDTGPTPGGGP